MPCRGRSWNHRFTRPLQEAFETGGDCMPKDRGGSSPDRNALFIGEDSKYRYKKGIRCADRRQARHCKSPDTPRSKKIPRSDAKKPYRIEVHRSNA